MLGFDINYKYDSELEAKTSIRNIAVPFNFTKCAYAGLKYAAAFAKRINAKLYVINCFQSTALAENAKTDVLQSTETYERRDEILKEAPELLEVSAAMLVEHSYLPEILLELSLEKKIDMVIMGSQITGDREKMFGTNASSLINHIHIPLLIVPDNVEQIELDNIMFAVDYKEFEDIKSVETLKTFAEISKAKVHIVHISNQALTRDQIKEEHSLELHFKGIDHEFYEYEYPNIHNGLKDFGSTQSIDLIAMTPRKHGFIENLYKGSETKKMALDTTIPLLVFND